MIALSLGIPLLNLNSYHIVDLAIDGANEVDLFLNLVKGYGGSLLNGKMEGYRSYFKDFDYIANLMTFGENEKPFMTSGCVASNAQLRLYWKVEYSSHIMVVV
ncbi:ribose-5-phosphate isomerase 2 [Spatholobus suberectus]|nr:ribose-5-phosphate isomerase 2 [Spatholobus suberectus]